MFIQWFVRHLKEYHGIYPIYELQTWGHCGCCGREISGEIFPKEWAWGICDKRKNEVEPGIGLTNT